MLKWLSTYFSSTFSNLLDVLFNQISTKFNNYLISNTDGWKGGAYCFWREINVESNKQILKPENFPNYQFCKYNLMMNKSFFNYIKVKN